ncbi:Peroxisomal biogenesis factor 19 [Pseudolycoriella hygida]|uniref:Peroxin-19 n=1 Tax=Pseudolycoriella hygida TaxID=35572 RepID=A0A9Q0S819_9DIPT|nr:Peroxisomal biogenesis factor 19 [Pseudolycoriella hygida]
MSSEPHASDNPSNRKPSLPSLLEKIKQKLLSAKVLLPLLRDRVQRYPVWLAENGHKIDPADKERYVKQLELYKIIYDDLQQEKPTDSTEVKSLRDKKVLDNMNKLHDYGQPPDEIADIGAETPPSFPMGNPSSKCPMMLLSPEVLLPILKNLLERYPVWLAENINKIDLADKERYVKQLELYKIIYDDLQQEKPTDSTKVNSGRDKKVLDNLKKLYDFGQPPDEIANIGAETPISFLCPMM